MKKENIKYTAILISFAIVVMLGAVLAKKIDEAAKMPATTAAKTYYTPSETEIETESLYIDENGKYFYNGYELVTDENGITLSDENGNMIQKVTDFSGNEATEAVSFPKFISDGSRLVCQQFSITLPEGWVDASSYNLRIRTDDESKSVDYSFINKTDENYESIDENIAELEAAFKPMIDDGSVKIAKSNTKISGKNAVKFVIEMNGENPSYMETYYVDTASGTMTFNCFCNYEEKGFDFKAILDTIEYRIK